MTLYKIRGGLAQGNSLDSRISGDGRLSCFCKSLLQIGLQLIELVNVRPLFVEYGLEDAGFLAQ